MTHRLLLAFMCVLFCMLFSVPVYALQIVYPADKTWVLRSNYLIIKGGTQPALDGVVVRVNGIDSDLIDVSATEYRSVFADMLILQPEWNKGKNRVEVVGFVNGVQVTSASADFYSLHDDTLSLPPIREYKRFQMHVPENEKICSPCHVMNPDKVQLSTLGDANPCASCHRGILGHKFVHGPAGAYQCSSCHDPDSRPGRYALSSREAELCNGCHVDKLAEYRSNPFVHGPVAVGMCSPCHDAHSSPFPNQLHATVNEVCMSCHSGIKPGEHVVRGVGGAGHPLEGKKNPMDPERPFNCASCHNPHSGTSRSLYVKKINGRFELCQVCHKK